MKTLKHSRSIAIRKSLPGCVISCLLLLSSLLLQAPHMNAQDKVWQSVNAQKTKVKEQAKAQQKKATTRFRQ